MKGCIFKLEKELKKEGRGFVDFKVEIFCNIIVLRWFDNKFVDVVLLYVGLNLIGDVWRWDKKVK